jgi:uncharacterized protein
MRDDDWTVKPGPVKKALLVIAGSISLALGVVGIFLPLLPTTPFLLLSAFCYMSSSKRLYDWLINHRIFGPYIYNYITYRAVRRNVKVGTLIILWLALLISIILVPNLYLRIFLLVVGVAVSLHILTLKTLAKEKTDGPDHGDEGRGDS